MPRFVALRFFPRTIYIEGHWEAWESLYFTLFLFGWFGYPPWGRAHQETNGRQQGQFLITAVGPVKDVGPVLTLTGPLSFTC